MARKCNSGHKCWWRTSCKIKLDKVSTFKSWPLKFNSMESTDASIKIITHWRFWLSRMWIFVPKGRASEFLASLPTQFNTGKQSHNYSMLAAGWRIISLEFTVCAEISIWYTCTTDGRKAKADIGVFPTGHATCTYHKCPDCCGLW